MMRTVTLELPEAMADQLDALTPERRTTFVAALLDVWEEAEAHPPELLEAIREGKVDAAAGRVTDARVIVQQLHERSKPTEKSPLV